MVGIDRVTTPRGRGEVLRQFQGTGGVRPAASIVDERLTTCSVCVGERVDGDSPASVRLPPGPHGSCRQKRNKYQDSGPQVFFSLLLCLSTRTVYKARVAYVRIDFIMTDSLMIPHKQYEDI